MDNKPSHLRIISDSPWSDQRSYAPYLHESLARNERVSVSPPISWLKVAATVALVYVLLTAALVLLA